MTVTAVGSLIFGLAHLHLQDSVAAFYGTTPDTYTQYHRFFGPTRLGFAHTRWFGYKVTSSCAFRAIQIGSLVASITNLVVSVIQVLNGAGNLLL
jgi:hypothetical protein